MTSRTFRFQVRLVDVERRVFTEPVDDHPGYAVACLAADAWRRAYGLDVVVWDRDERRALYDSRLFASKFQSPAVIAPTSSGMGEGGDESRGPCHGSSGACIAGTVSALHVARDASSSASDTPSASSE